MSPQLPKSAGNRDMYLMYSPAIRRVVSRAPADSKPIIASAARSGVGRSPVLPSAVQLPCLCRPS